MTAELRAEELEVVDVTGAKLIETDWLPHDLPAVLLKDWPEPGDLAVLENTNLAADGRTDLDHLARHQGEVIGPITPAELVAALAATGKRCRARCRHREHYQDLKDEAERIRSGEVSPEPEELSKYHSRDDVVELLLMAGYPVPERFRQAS